MAIIGIDLGTTNSLAAVWREGKSVLIPNTLGSFITPSVVSMDDSGGIVTGEIAKQRLVSHPGSTASLFKQFMGTAKTYTLSGIIFRPEDLSALILRSLKNDAEAFLNREVTEAIVSVPAYFNDTQRSATKTAGELSGLKVDRILNEPSAASLAYRQLNVRDGTNLVFDFGGGTLDVSVLEAFDNIVDILAVAGDNRLGGSDIDAAIVSEFLQKHPELDKKLSEQQRGILLKNAEVCKIALTDRQQVFMVYRHGDREYAMELDNEKLLQICSPMFIKFKEIIKRALQNAERPLALIDNVILVGGSCRMPLVREYIRQLTQKPVLSDIEPDYAVAIGVGVAAGIKGRDGDIRDMVLTDICPFSLGVKTRIEGRDGVFDAIIPRNTALPASRVHSYTTVDDNQKKVNFNVYQGESLEAEKNLLIGKYTISIPSMPAGKPVITVRFSYDINGILDIEIHCEQAGKAPIMHEIIVSNDRLTRAEINKRLDELNKLKTAPRGDEANALTIARGERLYEEFPGAVQAEIMLRLIEFQSELEKGANLARTAKLRTELTVLFDRLDAYSEGLLFYGEAHDESLDRLDE